MRAKVARVIAITSPDEEEAAILANLGDHAAPVGMHYLYDGDTQQIIEPALLYLYAMFGPDGRARDEEQPEARKRSSATNRAIAYELAEWFRFATFLKRRWFRADHELIAVYAHHLATNISVHSGKRRSKPTISHKISTVYGFYRFTNANGLKKGSSVRISGVSIGEVTKVALKPDDMSALVTFRVEASVKLDDDTAAAIKSAGLIGEKFVSLKPGSSGTAFKPGAVIVDTESTVDLEDIISRFAFGSVDKK